jgi:hypothetical protein
MIVSETLDDFETRSLIFGKPNNKERANCPLLWEYVLCSKTVIELNWLIYADGAEEISEA